MECGSDDGIEKQTRNYGNYFSLFSFLFFSLFFCVCVVEIGFWGLSRDCG